MKRMRRRLLLGLGGVALVLVALAFILHVEYAPLPSRDELANPDGIPIDQAYDVLGRMVSQSEAASLQQTPEGRRLLSPASGAIPINADVIRLGRDAFYRETYGNEYFLTDVVGMLDGGLSIWEVTKALVTLAGNGTNDLKVRLAKDVPVGDRVLAKGTLISTGLDVPKGGLFPLGVRVVYDRGTVRMGIACAVCHATVDGRSGKVVEGAPNTNLNVGLLLAISSNPAAYFIHAGVKSFEPFMTDAGRTVTTSTGNKQRLPEPEAVRRVVSSMLASWPPGNFDSSPDLVNNPTSIPSSFTAMGQPYGWSGHAGIGPFRGLSALNNNVHGLNSDETAQFAAAPQLFGLDPEVYLGILLQDAPNPRFRYDPASSGRPSAVLAAADPTPGTPGINRYAVLPSYPRANYVTTNGLLASNPDEPVGHSINAISPFQNSLRPPPTHAPPADVAVGRAVFERAGCTSCHSGPALTNNRVLPVEEIGTEPTRAKSFAKTEPTIAAPQLFAPDTPTKATAGARTVPIPMDEDKAEQVKLAWAHGGTNGGYKVPNLLGLAWSAPYLHDGGVAVGPDPERDLGMAGTFLAGKAPNPRNSLVALVDRERRARVVNANKGSPEAVASHVTGEGHAFWVDAGAGFSPADQAALVAYLLSVDRLTTDPPRAN
ncbi:cytochrome C oxidase Cbb3 [Chelatococcus sp. GCM10030263]|uniref:cytochrome C oxidase Cbb3 n=1 Tax=Chelatococcus sp. GCM10030263 TaxID=3273387 RepID=UPI00360CDE98